MKYIIILGDGMSDRAIENLGNKTPLQCADKPAFDFLAKKGRCGLLHTIPEGFPPGSEVGNMSILGYDVKECFEGRGPLEAASIGYDMQADDLALRCNIISTDETGNIKNHHGGNLTTSEGRQLIEYLDSKLGNDKIKFIPGIQYRHLLVIKGGKKGMTLFPPHDHVGENTRELHQETLNSPQGKEAESTALLLVSLIEASKTLLEQHPINLERKKNGKDLANSIWPWSEGYRPKITPLSTLYPHIHGGVMITAVDLLKGIGRYAGLKPVEVEGATGLADTNYEGKAQAAIDSLENNDFVFIHVEATDEASHDRDLELKIKAIEYLDHRIVKPVTEAMLKKGEPFRIALLPDHPTSVETGKHLSDAVPFVIFDSEGTPDKVEVFDEQECAKGDFGTIAPTDFIKLFLQK